MKRITILGFLFMTLQLFAQWANAYVEVRCHQDDCLKYGWEVWDRNAGSYGIRCTGEDCRTKGWEAGSFSGKLTVTCHNNDCFHHGWKEVIIGRNGFSMKDYRCSRGDCFRYGWFTGGEEVRCIRDDCEHYGWTTYSRQGRHGWSDTRCEREGCFVRGWVTYTDRR